MNLKLKIIDDLKTLKSGVMTRDDVGICFNITKMNNNSTLVHETVSGIAKKWKWYSGNVAFPVPDTIIHSYKDMYTYTSSRYDPNTTEGKRRLELIDFLIQELELPEKEFSVKYFHEFGEYSYPVQNYLMVKPTISEYIVVYFKKLIDLYKKHVNIT